MLIFLCFRSHFASDGVVAPPALPPKCRNKYGTSAVKPTECNGTLRRIDYNQRCFNPQLPDVITNLTTSPPPLTSKHTDRIPDR